MIAEICDLRSEGSWGGRAYFMDGSCHQRHPVDMLMEINDKQVVLGKIMSVFVWVQENPAENGSAMPVVNSGIECCI